MELTEQRLASIMRSEGQVFMKTVELFHEKKAQETDKLLDQQSNAYKAFSKNMESVAANIFGKQSRENSIQASRQLSMMKKNLEASEKLSNDEMGALKAMHSELAEVNKSLLDNEHSLKRAMSDSLKDSLPSIGGVLGAVGLDSPMILFMGTFLQGIMDKRKEARKAEQALMEDNHSEMMKQELEQTEQMNEELEEQNAKLSYIGGLLDVIVKGSESEKFEAIEKQRESLRMQEKMIDALEGTGGQIVDKNDGMLEGIMPVLTMTGLFAGITALGGIIMSAMSFLSPILMSVAGIAATAKVAWDGFEGAVDGWENAGEKLGKDSVSTSDRIASAIGGFFGGVWGLAEDLVNWIPGVKVEFTETIDMTITQFLADSFNFLKGLTEDVKRMWTDTKEYVSTTIDNIIETGKFIIDDFKNSIIEKFELLKEKLFSFELPDIPTIDALVGEGIEKVIVVIGDIFKNIASSLMNLDPLDMIKSIISPEFKPIDAKEIQKGNVFNTLRDNKIINDRILAKDTIKDASFLDQMSNDQLQELMTSGNFSKEDLDLIASKKNPTVADITGIQPRALSKQNATQRIVKSDIERERAMPASGSNVIAAPNINKTNNASSTTNVTSTRVSPRSANMTFRMLTQRFGF